MEDGRIKDSQITASSSYSEALHAATFSRLNLPDEAWSAGSNDANQWIQVDLGVSEDSHSQVVSGIVIQGDIVGQWVTEYKVQYSVGEDVWHYVKDLVQRDDAVRYACGRLCYSGQPPFCFTPWGNTLG